MDKGVWLGTRNQIPGCTRLKDGEMDTLQDTCIVKEKSMT